MSAEGEIRASAPGKVVLWGEYAVLAGAPALVMAVDRYATCAFRPGPERTWHLSAAGHGAAAAEISRSCLLDASPPESGAIHGLLWQVLQKVPAAGWAAGGEGHFDTAAFHQAGSKLGLGSSAALCVAIYGAVCQLLDQPAELESAFAIHRDFQGGAGSGIDVAAAWHGGTLRFRRALAGAPGEASPWALPGQLLLRCVWTGASASTGAHLHRLRCWLEAGQRRELDDLAAAASELFETEDPFGALETYTRRLDALDQAAGLGVFSAPHRRLQQLASAAGVVYKPCGAGGGDIGAAFTDDPAAADRFVDLARREGFAPLALETASHGLEVTG